MKYISSFFLLLLFTGIANGQGFNSIYKPKQINSIELRPNIIDTVTTVINSRDTVFLSDTVFVQAELKELNLAQLPLANLNLTSSFGMRFHPISKKHLFHKGIDLSANNDDVFSVLHGIVKDSGYNRFLGNYVIVSHGNYESIYGHLSTRYVVKDELVKAGSPIGKSGNTGNSTGEHLHFSIKYLDQHINPLHFLKEIMSIQKKDELTFLLTNIN